MRIIGLDFGSRTVGVAVCDPLMITAQGVEIIRRKEENKLRQTYARIEELCAEYNAERIVLGLPKNMNNTSGDRVDKTMDFKAALERRTGLEVVMWDERLTTVAADNAMMEAGIRRENRKEYVDMNAAQLILQGYLDSLAAEQKGEMIMSTRIQIIILAALILVFALMIFHINKKKLDFKFCLPWMLFILVCIILTCFPVILDRVAWLVGIASPMNMLFICGFCIALFIIYVLTVAISKHSATITLLTQRVAILEKELEEKEKKDEQN